MKGTSEMLQASVAILGNNNNKNQITSFMYLNVNKRNLVHILAHLRMQTFSLALRVTGDKTNSPDGICTCLLRLNDRKLYTCISTL